MKRFQVGNRLFGGPEVGFCDDFEQGGARPVEVDTGLPCVGVVNRFACIFFQVGPGDTHGKQRAIGHRHLKAALTNNRLKELTDLITFGKVRVKVIFSVEHRAFADLGTHTQAKHNGVTHSLRVEYRQHTGHAQVNGAGLLVGCTTKAVGCPGEDLALGSELQMDLKAHDQFPTHGDTPESVGRRR